MNTSQSFACPPPHVLPPCLQRGTALHTGATSAVISASRCVWCGAHVNVQRVCSEHWFLEMVRYISMHAAKKIIIILDGGGY